jgi:hypothetical protein
MAAKTGDLRSVMDMSKQPNQIQATLFDAENPFVGVGRQTGRLHRSVQLFD